MECARRVGARATGDRLCQLRRARRDAHGSRHPVVECAGAHGRDAIDGMADEARHPVALERVSPSPDAGQSRTFSRRSGTGAAGPRRAAKRAAALARRLSLGAQPCASARSPENANSGHRVAQERTQLRFPSSALGVSHRSPRVESGESWKPRRLRRALENRQGATRRVGATTASRATSLGVLLPHPGSRTGPEKSLLHRRRSLASGHRSRVKTVKDVPGQTVKHVMGLDTKNAEEWGTPHPYVSQIRTPNGWATRPDERNKVTIEHD